MYVYLEGDELPYGTTPNDWKMEQVTAYKCNCCGKMYLKPHYHRLCPMNPKTIHCRDCKNFFRDHDEYGQPANRCKKHHLHGYPGTPRKSSCPDVDIQEQYCGTWIKGDK